MSRFRNESHPEDDGASENGKRPNTSCLPSDAVAAKRSFNHITFLTAAVFAVVLADSLLRRLPFRPQMPSDSHDPSWFRVMQEGFVHHWAFGREIVFTNGPWAFFLLPYYHPSLYGIHLVIQGLLVLLVVISTWQIGYAVSRRPLLATAVAALLCFAATEITIIAYEAFYFLLIWYLAVYHFWDDVAPEEEIGTVRQGAGGPTSTPSIGARLAAAAPQFHRQALVAAAALLTLAKFSYAVVILPVIAAVALKIALQRRRIPSILPVYLLEVIAFWLLAGQRLADIIPFFRNSLEIGMGYPAMQLPGPEWIIACFALTAAILIAAIGWERWHAERWYAMFAVASFGLICFGVAKGSFVRHDWPHHVIGAFAMLAFCLTACAKLWRANLGRFVRTALLLSTIPALILTFPIAYASLGYSPHESDLWTRWFRSMGDDRCKRWTALVGMLRGSVSHEAAFERADEEIAAANPIPHIDGTMDVYPHNQAVLFAHSARYSPRPVIQSYSAYTPRLARMNADHLCGPSAPDCVLFGLPPFDHRFPSLDDGLSWPELWTRYELSSIDLPYSHLEYLVLDRSKEARPYQLVPIGERTAEIGEPVEVPPAEEGPIWAEIEIKPTLAGRLSKTVLKPPCVLVGVKLASGATGNYSLVPELAGAGFLLSPVVSNVSWFSWLASTPWSDPNWQRALPLATVRTMTIGTAGPWAFEHEFHVRFFRLKFEPIRTPMGVFSQRHLFLLQLATSPTKPCDRGLYWLQGPGVVLMTGHGTSLDLKVSSPSDGSSPPERSSFLRVGFGGIVTRRNEENQGRLGFRVSARDAAGNTRQIWEKVIEAGLDNTMTVIHHDVFAVDLSGIETVVFETLQEREGQSLVPFWFDARFE